MGFLGRLSKVNFDILALLRASLLFSKTFLVACPYGANFRYPEVQLLNWFQLCAGSWGSGHPWGSGHHDLAAAKLHPALEPSLPNSQAHGQGNLTLLPVPTRAEPSGNADSRFPTRGKWLRLLRMPPRLERADQHSVIILLSVSN